MHRRCAAGNMTAQVSTSNYTAACLSITAELGSALAVVKVTLQVSGNCQFLGVHTQNYWGNKDKIQHK